MQSNIIEKRKPQPIILRPITVICVLDDLGYKDDRLIKMREFCRENRINYMTRIFDSQKYSEDRHNISRLPAFHIKIKKNWQRTFYPNTRPYQHVQECIEIYEKRLNKKTLLCKFYIWLKSCFTKGKTEQKKDWS